MEAKTYASYQFGPAYSDPDLILPQSLRAGVAGENLPRYIKEWFSVPINLTAELPAAVILRESLPAGFKPDIIGAMLAASMGDSGEFYIVGRTAVPIKTRAEMENALSAAGGQYEVLNVHEIPVHENLSDHPTYRRMEQPANLVIIGTREDDTIASGENSAMGGNRVYALRSGEGYGADVGGNFVEIRYSRSVNPDRYPDRYSVHLKAFPGDRNRQYQSFDTLAEAVAWGVAAAQSHRGRAHDESKIVHWEIRHGSAITVTQTDDGGYEGETFMLWYDIDPSPIRNFKKFPTFDEALEYGREWAEGSRQATDDYHRIIREIGDVLAAQIGNSAGRE